MSKIRIIEDDEDLKEVLENSLFYALHITRIMSPACLLYGWCLIKCGRG